ncbi:Glycosyl hydrolase family protein [Striga hermonthica]|uniref:Glycosyl hydrolase family protein n=1 Tax=Striga hermonthica TaxID=68872 RepID=A0A9N7RN05_STRHE|nr:Glycosyl hydrolase family protein [Striga hermonthica]
MESLKRAVVCLMLLLLWTDGSKAQTHNPSRIDTRYKNPKLPMALRVRSLLAQMTLKEKIGQMSQLNHVNITADILREYSPGSLISGAGETPRPDNRATPQDWINFVNDYQKGSMSSRLGIPMLYSIDSVHGHNSLYRATIFPHNVGLGATRDRDLVKRIGAATALETRATGIPFAFAPCIAVCRDPRWGRCYESFSEDPLVVEEMTDMILGLQGDNGAKGVPYVGGKDKVVACAKHYVGDGGTTSGRDENNTIANWHGLLSMHMPGYYHAIIKGVSTIMVSYSSWNGQKMHANRTLVTDFLKGVLNFRGFVISDWQGVDRMTDPWGTNYSASLATAINAGVDMVMVPPNATEFLRLMTSHVENNLIPMSRIDDAVSRILRVKFIAGLFDQPLADNSLVGQIRKQEHMDLAREAVRKSLVLLKNGKEAGKPMIPLPKKASKILVAGTHANNLGLQCGGWTVFWQGIRNSSLIAGTTILNGITLTVDPSTQVVYSENPDSDTLAEADEYSYAIVVVGELPYAEQFGDNFNLTIPEPGLSTINNVCDKIKCVVVLISGRPLVIEPYLPKIDALVAAWLPGAEGQGVADVLYGDYGFTGKLPRTWFKRVDQLPMNFGDAHYDPLFPYGGNTPREDHRATPEEWVDMINAFQNGSLSSRLGIPLLYAIDSVHGHNSLYRATIFPHNVGLGVTRDPELVRKIGAATAVETRATGIPYAFSPCIAVCRDPRWGRCYESYSEDPQIVTDMTDIILGLQGDNGRNGVPYIGGKDKVVACAKHFVGDGGTVNGINENNTIIDWYRLMSIHMSGYYQAVIKGVSTIMVSFSSLNGQKMHGNKNLVTDFLKGTLRFRGFVISDWQGIDKMTDTSGSNYSTSLATAINAGVDMVMVPPNHTEFLRIMSSHVENNIIPITRINDAVSRILRVKFTLGFFENPLADYSLIGQINNQAHKDLAREAVRKSLVLLKNGNVANRPLLPLPKKTSKILVAGTHANNLGLQCGGWTVDWQGVENNTLISGTTILNAISVTVDPSTEIVYSENPDSEILSNANEFSYAIVVVGEKTYAEQFGDNLNLSIPEPGLSTMNNVCNKIKCVVVIVSGRPLVVEPYLSKIDGLVAAWLPGTEGQGVVDVLFGDYAFTGKLSRTWFKRVDQLPMNVGDKHYDPLFPFGFGLATHPVVADM